MINLLDTFVPFSGRALETGVMLDGTTRFTCKGNPVYHYNVIGTATFSEYSVVPEIAVVKVSILSAVRCFRL